MRRFAVLLAMSGMAAAASAAEPPAMPGVAIETASGAVTLRPSITVDGQPLVKCWDDYLTALFAFLDRDENDALDPSEASRAPRPELLRNQWRADFDNVPDGTIGFTELDRTPRDGRVTREELAEYYRRTHCGLLEVRSQPSPAAWHDHEVRWLFERLESGEAIDAQSLADAYGRLRAADADDDERLSAAELRAACRATASGLPQSRGRVAIARLAPAESRGALDVSLRLAIDQSHGRGFEGPSGRPVDSIVYRHQGNLLRQVATAGSGAMDFDSACWGLREQFTTDDLDRDGSLDQREIAPSVTRATFARLLTIADVNANGRLEAGELKRYLDLQARAARTAVLVVATELGRPLFEFLDADGDQALSLRELRHGWGQLRQADENGNGRLTLEELPRQYELTWSVGRPSAQPASSQPVRQAHAFPRWFRAMDRNGDGDISRREFLGPRADFERLDTDDDRLISPTEATARFRQASQAPTQPKKG